MSRQEPTEGVRLAKGEKVGVWISSGKGKVEVPRVVGMDQVTAAQVLGNHGLDVKTEEEVSKEEQPGTVLRQKPGAGEQVEAGVTVVITVAVASDAVAVPRLIGKTEEIAVALLASMGLVARPQPVESTLEGGTVVDQSPGEGTEVQPGSTVDIFISNAPEPTTVMVPAVAGLGYTPSQAASKLGQYQLHAKITYYETPDYEPDWIIQQDPAAGAVVQRGSYVELLVAKAPVTTTTTSTTTTTTEPPTTVSTSSTESTTPPPTTEF